MTRSTTTTTSSSPDTADMRLAGPLGLIAEALDRLKFGAVHLTVHEGRLVQIEVTEKTRLTA